MIYKLISGFLSMGINSYFDYKIKKAETDTERLKITTDRDKNLDRVRAEVLMNGSWKFQLFLLIPTCLWFSSVVLYSTFFCGTCILPYAGLGYTWSMAALPPPLDWAFAAMVGFLFLTKGK